jgi:alkanesulfonate monooxygenase SsuD/methylene tetrahydromethanopterin reductase-like flavin-dependent oxidoreductase (luciferase family)
MGLEFGITYDFRNAAHARRPWPDLVGALLDQIVRAEELGFDAVWLNEHHGHPEGYNPAPLTTAAAIAARTSRIRIGTFVLVLPFHDPVRVAEDAAAIDVLSNGRFELGVGQGYDPREFHSLDVDRRERAARLEEGVHLLRRLWGERNVTFEGKFRRVRDFTLEPRPVQPGGPPLWIGARAPGAIRRAARLGAHLLTTIGPDPAPAYLEALRAEGQDASRFRIGQLRLVYVAPTEDEAWSDVAPHLQHSMAYYERALAEANDVAGDDGVWPFRTERELRRSGFARSAMVGAPEQVRERLARFVDRVRCTHLICNTQVAGLDPARGTRALELFAREVMPAFRNELC